MNAAQTTLAPPSDRSRAAANALRVIADRLESEAWDLVTLSAAERLIERAQHNLEVRAAQYTIEAIGPGESPPFAVMAHVDGVGLRVAEYASFDLACAYCSAIYTRRRLNFGIDRVAPGKWATRPFTIGRGGN